MARNRMIKSDFPEDEKIGKLSRNARLLFILSWIIADDSGVFRGSPTYIKNRLFPYDNVVLKEITTWLNELTTHGVLSEGSNNGETYYFIKNFSKHQVISRPSKFRYVLADYEAIFKNTHGVLSEGSLMKDKDKVKDKVNVRAQMFESFWTAYPKKKSKKKAREAFNKTNVNIDILLNVVEKLKGTEEWKKEGGKYIPYPATWLNAGGWDDEPTESFDKQKPDETYTAYVERLYRNQKQYGDSLRPA